MSDAPARTVTMTPIGYVRNGSRLKFQTPHQPNATADETNTIVLNPGHQFELALQDLDGFARIWLVFWFDKNKTWRPRVMPPRGPARRRGVFATRSPHRPNPVGLTCASLIAVNGLTLTVGPLDLIDGTPILDIKPYLPTADAFPDSAAGWVDEVDAAMAAAPRYDVEVAGLAARQLSWLREQWQIDFTERAFALLAVDPRPHRTRRILGLADGRFRMACGCWRLFYTVEGTTVTIQSVEKGYADESIFKEGRDRIPDREAQIAFRDQFGSATG